jgi:hypothetical protein
MESTAPDFFIFNYQIYADATCNELTNLVKNDYRYWQNIEGNFKRVNDIDCIGYMHTCNNWATNNASNTNIY